MFTRLIYTSQIADQSPTSLSDIIIKSIENNIQKDITGILIWTKKNYVQALEGDKEELDKLYSIIENDSRHKNVTLIYQEPATDRIFKDWSMKAFFFDKFAVELKDQLREKFQLDSQDLGLIEDPNHILEILEYIYHYFNDLNKEVIYG